MEDGGDDDWAANGDVQSMDGGDDDDEDEYGRARGGGGGFDEDGEDDEESEENPVADEEAEGEAEAAARRAGRRTAAGFTIGDGADGGGGAWVACELTVAAAEAAAAAAPADVGAKEAALAAVNAALVAFAPARNMCEAVKMFYVVSVDASARAARRVTFGPGGRRVEEFAVPAEALPLFKAAADVVRFAALDGPGAYEGRTAAEAVADYARAVRALRQLRI